MEALMAITQASLRKLLLARKRVAGLEASIKRAEGQLLEQLKAGATVQDGLLAAYVKTWERRSPAWKAIVERELGEDYAARVLSATKPDTFTKLAVEVA